MFCDASAEAYGFVAYVVQNHRSELVFAKVVPKKSKSLPTLELMAVYLVLEQPKWCYLGSFPIL